MTSAIRPLFLAALFLIAPVALAQTAREQGLEPAIAATRLKPADIRADQIDRLFARLVKTEDGGEARRVEDSIWKLWMITDSPTAEVLLAQAMKATAANENETALGILDSVITVHPDFAEAWNKRATLYFLLGRFDDSIKDIEQVLDREPRHFGALSGLGMIKRRQGDLAAARAAFGEALAINPHMEGVKRALEEIESQERPI